MLKTIFKIGAISLQLVKFDTQDNLVKTCEATDWSQNVNLDTFQPLQTYGLWRYAPTKIWFKSKTPVKAIAINNFPYWYKVKRISLYHYEIECKKMQNYFDQTDVIEIIVKK